MDEELTAAAERLAALAPGATAEEAAALAWAWRNGRRVPMPREPLFWAGLACAVAGQGADPTGGAARFHRHTEHPAWARTRRPTALIGRFLFYA